jgi:hypothetical protein
MEILEKWCGGFRGGFPTSEGLYRGFRGLLAISAMLHGSFRRHLPISEVCPGRFFACLPISEIRCGRFCARLSVLEMRERGIKHQVTKTPREGGWAGEGEPPGEPPARQKRSKPALHPIFPCAGNPRAPGKPRAPARTRAQASLRMTVPSATPFRSDDALHEV